MRPGTLATRRYRPTQSQAFVARAQKPARPEPGPNDAIQRKGSVPYAVNGTRRRPRDDGSNRRSKNAEVNVRHACTVKEAALPALALLWLAGCSGDDDNGVAPPTEIRVARTAVVFGDGQVRLPGTPVPEALIAVGVDAAGQRVERAGLPVEVTVTVGEGSAESRSDVTDARGLVYMDWTLGTVGTQELRVSIDGSPAAVFAADAVLAGPILFSSDREVHDPRAVLPWDLYAMEADGSNVVPLTFGDYRDRDSSWSPDGRTIVFERFEGPDTIMQLSLPDLIESPFPYQNSEAGTFRWSPDGTRIAFSMKRPSNGCTRAEHNVWVMDADGSDPVRVTGSPCGTANKFPSWSFDGTVLAFESEEGLECCSAAAVWTMTPDGQDQTRVSADLGYRPHWLPDGRRLVVGGWAGEPEATLRVLDAETGGAETVWVPARARYVMPGGVSPDGRFAVAEVSLEGADSDVFRIDLETGEAVNLTNRSGGFDGFPSWGPGQR